MVSAIEISELNHRFDLASVDEILRWIWERFGTHAAIGTSFQGAGLVLIDVALKNGFQFPVFTIDTGKLFHETVELKGRLEDWFGVNIESVKPELNLERQTETYGSNLWDSDPNLCCNLRKVVPLERKLSTLSCWITGLRRQQSATRDRIGQLELFHLDREAGREIVKMNPLANWRKEDVWKYGGDKYFNLVVHNVH